MLETFFLEKVRAIFLNKETPTKDLLRQKLREGKVGVISPDADLGAKKNRSKSGKSFDNGK